MKTYKDAEKYLKPGIPVRIVQDSGLPEVEPITWSAWHGTCQQCGAVDVAYTKKNPPRRRCQICKNEQLMWINLDVLCQLMEKEND